MDIREYKQLAKLIRDNEVYKVYDLPGLEDIEISLTELRSHKSTIGHSHDKVDEVYIFINGGGNDGSWQKTIKVKSRRHRAR